MKGRCLLQRLLLFSSSVMSDSLWPHRLWHTRLPCPSSSLGACSNSCPLSRWCHPTISSAVTPFSSCLQSFPASGSFLMNLLFASCGSTIETSASASVLLENIQDWFPLGLIDWFDLLAAQGSLKSLLQHHCWKASILWHSAFLMVQLSHVYMTTGKTIALTRQTFVGKVISLFFNVLSRLVIAFLPRSKCLLISWLKSPSAVILEPMKIKSVTVSTDSYLSAMKWWDRMPWSSFSECWILSQLSHFPLSPSSRGCLVSLCSLP